MSRPAAMMVKESIGRAYETTLGEGIRELAHAGMGLAVGQERSDPQTR